LRDLVSGQAGAAERGGGRSLAVLHVALVSRRNNNVAEGAAGGDVVSLTAGGADRGAARIHAVGDGGLDALSLLRAAGDVTAVALVADPALVVAVGNLVGGVGVAATAVGIHRQACVAGRAHVIGRRVLAAGIEES